MAKKRADVLIFEQGLAASREKAKRIIMEGRALIGTMRIEKPGEQIDEDETITIKESKIDYVSRGGLKLEKAIEVFDLNLEDVCAMDIGASTGGFTDVMLRNGAKLVYAIDVGYNQLAYKLRIDPRVVVMEKTNIRYLDKSLITNEIDFISIDVSFISLKLVLPIAKEVIKENGYIVALIKPQFEVGKNLVGKNGIVRDEKARKDVIEDIFNFSIEIGLSPVNLTYSPIKGAKGNVEFLVLLKNNKSDALDKSVIEEVLLKSNSLEWDMLLELKIQNFAIIDDVTIEFTEGMNILTGETGSGKSIIIDALSTVLGGKAYKEMIKSGADSAFVEAVFCTSNDYIKNKIREFGIEIEDLIVISRIIKSDRPSISRVNGKAVTLNVLNEITESLIDIFAQEESQSLMNTKNQLRLLDFLCGKDHLENLNYLRDIIDEISEISKKIKDLKDKSSNREREIDILKYQLDEIDSANLTPYDDEELEQDYKKQNNMSEIINHLNLAVEYLNSDYENNNAIGIVDSCIGEIVNISKYDQEYEETLSELEDIKYRLQDISSYLNRKLSTEEVDEENLRFLENRLDLVNSLKKKYGNNLELIDKFYDDTKTRLEQLENLEEILSNLKNSEESLYKEAYKIAEKISNKRKEISKELEIKLKSEMRDLNIKNADFMIKIKDQKLNKDGIDDVEFFIKTNLGMEFLSLSKTASGGEMSRIMLAFKSIISNYDEIETLIFDEIDTGVSGFTANIVGNKIKELSTKRQVIAISHLPQIVALGDSHFKIYKEEIGDKTVSNIIKLENDERVDEIARLIGGQIITDNTIKAAKEMLKGENNGKYWKNN